MTKDVPIKTILDADPEESVDATVVKVAKEMICL
jgi:hypothetical protein